MADTLISRLIQKYEQESGALADLQAHCEEIAAIAEEFVAPNDISPEDLNRLVKAMGNLLKIMKKKNVKSQTIGVVKDIIAKISEIATKKVSQRREQDNRYLLDLSDKLMELRTYLSSFFSSGILLTFIEHCNTL